MNLKTFKKISSQVNELEKAGIEFDVIIRNDNEWQQGASVATFEPAWFKVTSLKQLADVQVITNKTVSLTDQNNKIEIPGLIPTPCVRELNLLCNEIKKQPTLKVGLNTLKFYSNEHSRYWYQMNIYMITQAPTEQTEDDVTYRYIGDKNSCMHCIPDTHPMYNYLDRGFFFTYLTGGNKKPKLIVTNELTVDTYLCILLCWIDQSFTKQLVNECYINANQAKLLRIKFEKALKDQTTYYAETRDKVLKEFEKTANSNIMQRVAEGKVPHTIYNDIKFTAKSASYETVSIEADDLLTILQSYVAFDDRTDIYSIIRDYIRYVIATLDSEDLSACSEAKIIEHPLKINGIPLVLKRTSENTRRYLNGITINKQEVEEVAFQSSCYHDADTYNKFVKSVSKMSLKWHNALANGVAMKIHGNITWDEYRKPEAPAVCPRVKFKKVGKDFQVVVADDGTAVNVRFNDCLKELAKLNRNINNSWTSTAYSSNNRKDFNWGKVKLQEVLKACCTFVKKTYTTVEVDEPQFTDTGLRVKDALGNDVFKKFKKKTSTSTTVCTISDEQAKYVGNMADAFHKKAVEKSVIALANAVQRTGAKPIQFLGEEAYHVKGTIREYAVLKASNKVYNFNSKAYVCIVDSGHHVQVGFDALASRLYALKNDSVLVGKIGTLK